MASEFVKRLMLARRSPSFALLLDPRKKSIHEIVGAGGKVETMTLEALDIAQKFGDSLALQKWAEGAQDGAYIYDSQSQSTAADATVIFNQLKLALTNPTDVNVASFYRSIKESRVVGYIDDLVGMISANRVSIDPQRLCELNAWLIYCSPDCEPVKFAIAVYGMFVQGDQIRKAITLLGSNNEFTLFVAVAMRQHPDPDMARWNLAKKVHGWGRVHLIKHLSKSQNPDIKYWMLREGYKCDLIEYTVYTCATTGGLLRALEQAPDAELLTAAGTMIRVLIENAFLAIAGVQVCSIYEYEDGAQVVERYLALLDENVDPMHLEAVSTIKDFMEIKGRDWSLWKHGGWTNEMRERINQRIKKIMAWPMLNEKGDLCGAPSSR